METVNNGEAAPANGKTRRPGTFAPGNGGGPGRPPMSDEDKLLRASAKKVFALAVDKAVQNIAEALAPGVPQAINVISELATDPNIDPAVRLQACREYLDRSLGRPMQSSQIAIADVTPKLDRIEAQRRIDAILAGKHVASPIGETTDADILT